MPSKPAPDRFLNFKEVAAMIGLNEGTVRNGECGTNEIPRIKLGSRVLFSFLAVQQWMASKAREAEEDQRRESTTVYDLMTERRRRKNFVKAVAQSVINEEKRRWER